jgi:hypothetical protein
MVLIFAGVQDNNTSNAFRLASLSELRGHHPPVTISYSERITISNDFNSSLMPLVAPAYALYGCTVTIARDEVYSNGMSLNSSSSTTIPVSSAQIIHSFELDQSEEFPESEVV